METATRQWKESLHIGISTRRNFHSGQTAWNAKEKSCEREQTKIKGNLNFLLIVHVFKIKLTIEKGGFGTKFRLFITNRARISMCEYKIKQ